MSRPGRRRFFHLETCEERVLMATDLGSVLQLGDSITEGSTLSRSYRYELWKDLIDNQIAFEPVGTETESYHLNNPEFDDPEFPDYLGNEFVNQHEGHWGWTSSQVRKELPSWLPQYDADVALIHLGTNDLRLYALAAPSLTDAQIVAGPVSELNQIVTLLQEDNPHVTIYIAEILPYYKTTVDEPVREHINSLIVQYNQAISETVASWSTETSQVMSVDQWSDPNNAEQPAPEEYFFDGVHPSPLGEVTIADRWLSAIVGQVDDSVAPRVTDVKVNSTNWVTSYRQFMDSEGEGVSLTTGSSQMDVIPYYHLDQLVIQFSEDVEIDLADVELTGVNTPGVPIEAVHFDSQTNTATISLEDELTADRYTLSLKDSVSDLANNLLDGEWINAVSMELSGDGQEGGSFLFEFNVLPGDVAGAGGVGNGIVDTSDILAVRSMRFENITTSDYDPRFDSNGNGIIDTSDILMVRAERFSFLPLPANAIAASDVWDNRRPIKLFTKLRPAAEAIDAVFEANRNDFR